MPTTKRVVIVSDYGDIRGGLEKVAIESALALRAFGLEVVFFCGVAPLDPRMEAAGIRVECLFQNDISSFNSRLEGAKVGLWNKVAAERLNKVIRDTAALDQTVVHVHGWTKSLSSAIGPVVTAPGIRHVFTMHEYFFACPNGGFYDYQKNEICHRKAMGASCITTNCDSRGASYKAFRIVRQVVQRGFGGLPRSARNIIYISQLQHDVMRPYFSPETNFHKVENPAVSDKNDAIDVASNRSFFFVGRLVETKGALEFAHAAKSAGIEAVFIGDGPLREDVLKANPDAKILGWMSPDMVAQTLLKARTLVFPSLWYECQPLVPIEAAALGIPVICGDWGAARETVIHEKTGLHLSSIKPDEGFIDALERLNVPSYAKRLGQQAYDTYWADPLTMDRHINNLLGAYEKVQTV